MTRRIRNEPTYPNWHKPVADCEIAPHRYTDDHDSRYEWAKMDYKEWKAAIPYHGGDVVWCEFWTPKGKIAKRAIILDTFVDGDARQRTGDRRPKYRIAYETAAGKWGKLFTFTFPGMIQRGYQIALAAAATEGE